VASHPDTYKLSIDRNHRLQQKQSIFFSKSLIETQKLSNESFFYIHWDSFLLLLLCFADMATTIYWIHCGAASEANPLLATALHYSVGWFIAIKLLSFVPAVVLAELYRKRNPRFVAICFRIAILIYSIIYFGSIANQFFA
jgi:hypothetical protein